MTAPLGTTTAVGQHSASVVDLAPGDQGYGLTIVPVTGGVLDPCDHHSAEVSIPPGIDGVLTYLDGLAEHGITANPTDDVSIGGIVGRSVAIETDACFGGMSWFHQGRFATGGPSGSRVTLIEPRPGTILAVIASPEVLAQPEWLDALLASIDVLD